MSDEQQVFVKFPKWLYKPRHWAKLVTHNGIAFGRWGSVRVSVHGTSQTGALLRIKPFRGPTRADVHPGVRFVILGVAAAADPLTAQEFVVIEGPTPDPAWDPSTPGVAVIRIAPPLRCDGPAPTVVELPENNAVIFPRP